MEHRERNTRYLYLRVIVGIVCAVLLGRLCYVQLIDDKYDALAKSNIMRSEVEYPMRGEVLDRRGEFLVKSRVCYDVMVVTDNIPKTGFDTVRLASILEITPEKLAKQLDKADNSPHAPFLVVGYLSQDAKLLLDEESFDGFYTRFRTAREYPRKIGGNLLGYVGEVNQNQLKRWSHYDAGDYIGVGGIESAYETELRGEKGVSYRIYDTHGAVMGEYDDGALDILPVKGKQIVSTIDGRLQEFAEELMQDKVGAVVAIEPSTGEILVMVSSPTYNPDLLVGRQRGNSYMELLHNQRTPLYNRAVMAKFPPGSTFKLVQGLIGLQEGVLRPSDTHPCSMGYTYGVGRHNRKLKCHSHRSPLNLRQAVAESCNAYFCYVFKDIITNPKYGSTKEGLRKWNEYVSSFGFGKKLGSDFTDELTGFVPTPEFYDDRNNGRWNWGTVISCAIGQGEMECTPMQLANLAAIIANRGYYYIPHIVKHVEGEERLDERFYKRNYTLVDSVHFETIIDGMWRSVNVAGTSRKAYLEGWDVCGKTGTAENRRQYKLNGVSKSAPDHSAFLSFAPRNNPRIAIMVYVEHGGFGSAIAVPIASLIEEMYLTDTIKRPQLVEEIKNTKLNYGYYDYQQQKYDASREQE